MGSPATGTLRSLKETVKLPIFWFLVRIRLIGPVVAVWLPVSVAVSRRYAVPFKSTDGSNVPRVPLATVVVPVESVWKLESSGGRYSSTQFLSAGLSTVPVTVTAVVTSVPSRGDAIDTVGLV